MIHRIFILSLLISVPIVKGKKQTLPHIHEIMTEDDILNVFHTTPDTVPEYEVVSLEHTLHKRSAPKYFRLKFKAFDKDIDIYLNPNEGVLAGEDTPIWIAEDFPHRVLYRRLKKGILKEALGVYQSLSDRAALVVTARGDEHLKFYGTVEDLTIKPVPKRVQDEINRTNNPQRDLSRTTRSMMITEYHIVFKSNKGINQTNTAQQLNETTINNIEDFTKQIDVTRSKRANEDVIFPNILVTTDFNVPVKYDEVKQYYDQIIYQLAFWNAVDLKYRHLDKPKVRLQIAGFIIGSVRRATPYLRQHMVNGEVEVFPAITDMRKYWHQMTFNRDFSTESFHVVTTATNLNLFGKDNSGTKTNYGGLSRIASFCLRSTDNFYPAILFNDDRSFGGINTAVHELAHVLGAYHDNSPKDECGKEDGYLMAPMLSTTENNPTWSKCSLERMSRFLRDKDCADKPKGSSGKPLERILPGNLKTAEQQCQGRGFDWACKTTPSICKVLRCWNSGFKSFFETLLMCQDSHSAAEGTECAPDRVCLDGECRSL